MIEQTPPQPQARAAQHCEELLANALETSDVAGDFARFGTRLGRALQPRLAKLFDANKLAVELQDCVRTTSAELAATLGERQHHARFALPGKGLGMLASIGVGAVIGEFDRMLGGEGDSSDKASALPASADRFARQIEGALLEACIDATGRGDLSASERGSELKDIVPAAARSPVHIATFAVERAGLPKLTIRIATCEASFVLFAGETPVGRPVRSTIGDKPVGESAIGQIELSTTATLVDMAIPLHRIVALRVGAMLPIAIHRSVPLSIADTVIAHGAVGALDDRVALEIHHTAFAKGS